MKSFLISLLLIGCVYCSAQNNYTGKYGYQESYKSLKERHPSAGKDETGYSQKLYLMQLNKNRYRFWLFVVKGYPSYNSGEIAGNLTIKKNKASFVCTDSLFAASSCQLDFQLLKKMIVIKQGKGNCGFGHGVAAVGEYPKLSSSLTTKNLADLGQQASSKFFVSAAKAYLYQDKAGLKRKEQYFIQNDVVYRFDENDDMIFIQHISKTGKYVEGWISKKDLSSSKKK